VSANRRSSQRFSSPSRSQRRCAYARRIAAVRANGKHGRPSISVATGWLSSRKTALSHGDAGKGDYKGVPNHTRGAYDRQRVGSGADESRQPVQVVRCGSRDATARAHPYHVAGRQHDRVDTTPVCRRGSSSSRKVLSQPDRDVAGPIGCAVGTTGTRKSRDTPDHSTS